MDAFQGNASFEFLLKANGHADVHVGASALYANCSSGGGQFQGFVVRLPAGELPTIASGVEYTIEPINQDKKYYWVADESVTLVRP